MTLRGYSRWTAREDEMLICLIKCGASAVRIAARLGRTKEGIYQRRRKLRKAGALPAAFHYKK